MTLKLVASDGYRIDNTDRLLERARYTLAVAQHMLACAGRHAPYRQPAEVPDEDPEGEHDADDQV